MLKMLVVDDEKFEREGIKFLVHKYNLNVELAEADSGEKALAYLDKEHVDILFTDIRMNGMDGLELAEQVKKRQPHIKVIILSAYGEFEYAQKAIDLRAIQYILKPVQVSEFLEVIKKVIQICEEEQAAKQLQARVEETRWQAIRYEKQKMLSDLIQGKTELPDNPDELGHMNVTFEEGNLLRLMMLDTKQRFFDMLDLEVEHNLSQLLSRSYEMIHLNERQCLLLLESNASETKEQLHDLGDKLILWFNNMHGIEVSIVVSSAMDNMAMLYKEYNHMETILENKFFFDKSRVFLTNQAKLTGHSSSNHIDEALSQLMQTIERGRVDHIKLHFDQLFDALQNSEHYSVIYVKYMCSDILKALLSATAKRSNEDFKAGIAEIYATAKLSDLRQVMHRAMDLIYNEAEGDVESVRKVIDDVVAIIETEYSKDLSLDALAERVYFSPTYLSHLFKKEKGVSINKFITAYRMEKASELLLTTNRRIADIGVEVGYANVPYFSSLFKNYYGKTPTLYREEAGI